MKCSGCRFWVEQKEQTDGECRANPPQILLVPRMRVMDKTSSLFIDGFFPKTRPDLWCGKYMGMVVVTKDDGKALTAVPTKEA